MFSVWVRVFSFRFPFVYIICNSKNFSLYVDVVNPAKSLCFVYFIMFFHLFLHNLFTITFLCNLIRLSSICLDCLHTRICVCFDGSYLLC